MNKKQTPSVDLSNQKTITVTDPAILQVMELHISLVNTIQDTMMQVLQITNNYLWPLVRSIHPETNKGEWEFREKNILVQTSKVKQNKS